MNDKNTSYEDIIHLPHPVSATHPQMPVSDRAAQFAPFAALTGYEAAIKETARQTDEKVELDENEKAILDEKLRMVQETLGERPEITITYFQQDDKKAGGSYISVTGYVKKIDPYGHSILMEGGLRIHIDEILGIEGEMFNGNFFSPY